jgi:hypothetical protein
MISQKIKDILLTFGVPILVLLTITFLFAIESWRSFYQVMTVSFIFFLPFIAGSLTIYRYYCLTKRTYG